MKNIVETSDGILKIRGFEPVSKYVNEKLKMPVRSTRLSAGYDIFNNTGSEIVIEPGELSEAISTKIKAYMLGNEFLGILPRSGHGFKYSVRLANTFGVIDCVPGDTIISTPTGDYTVLDIINKGIVNIYSYNEVSDSIEEDLLTDVVEVDGINMVEMTLEDGSSVKIPETKECYTDRGWVKVKDLTLDDKILKIV